MVADAVNIPVVAHGGASSFNDIVMAFNAGSFRCSLRLQVCVRRST